MSPTAVKQPNAWIHPGTPLDPPAPQTRWEQRGHSHWEPDPAHLVSTGSSSTAVKVSATKLTCNSIPRCSEPVALN